MISPFLLYKNSVELVSFFPIIDEFAYKRRKFVQLYLQTHNNNLTNSKSEDISIKIYKYQHLYMKNVGFLMIKHKKPFRVHFKLNEPKL